MNDASPTYDDDEINLAELAHTLWDGKWLIAAITAVCVVFAGAFALLAPKSYSGSLELRPLLQSQSQRYNELNQLKFFDIKPSTLVELLAEDLSERATLTQAIQAHSSFQQRQSETAEDFSNRLLASSYRYKISPPTTTGEGRNRDARPHWKIDFTVQEASPDIIRAILSGALAASTDRVRRAQTSLFSQSIEMLSRQHSFSTEDLTLSASNLKEDYEKRIRNRLAFLGEQAQIARTLGIAKNTIEAQFFQSGSSVVANVTTDNPFYLRGFEAIEKEISLLKTRRGVEAFIAELIEIENKKRAIAQDQSIQRAQMAFNNTPIVVGDFSAAFYDIASIEFKSNIKPPLILALALVGGGFLAIVVVLIRSGMRKYKKP